MDIIVGTAGHIDHGKTALVKALTGIDADRLPEEKKRGITIDLGFAELDLDGVKIGFVDVPGHEKFVKNMLAGASGIDLVTFVIAADEGVMPQTREHFEICRLLEIKNGLIVITKKDLVDDEFLELVKLDIEELIEDSFLQDAKIAVVSTKTGEGIDPLKTTLKETALAIPDRKNEIITRLPIDRTFTVKGFGAVVTGTLATGGIKTGTEMELLPVQKRIRIRGIQTHGNDVTKANAGQRTALNLGSIDHKEIERGMVICEPDILQPTQIIDTEIEVLKESARPLKSRQRVRVHIGTIEALARIEVLNNSREILPGEKGFVQIRLEKPIVAIPNERFILRHYSPQITIAGGKVLDNAAKKHRSSEFESVIKYLSKLSATEPKAEKSEVLKLFLETASEKGLTFSDLQGRTGWKKEILANVISENLKQKSIIAAEGFYIARTPFDKFTEEIINEVETHHKNEPLSKGILRETLREKVGGHIPVDIFRTALKFLEENKQIVSDKDIVKASTYNQELSNEETLVKKALLNIYTSSGFHVPTLENALNDAIKETKLSSNHARKIFQLLVNLGEVVKITEDYYFDKNSIVRLIENIQNYAENESENRLITIPIFKELAGVSRKYAIPLLEYLDSENITKRAGDKRIIL